MGGKSSSKQESASTTTYNETVETNNLDLIGSDLNMIDGDRNQIMQITTDYGAVGDSIDMVKDVALGGFDFAEETANDAYFFADGIANRSFNLAGRSLDFIENANNKAQTFAQEAGRNAMGMVDNLARDPNDQTTVLKYGFGVAALAVVALMWRNK